MYKKILFSVLSSVLLSCDTDTVFSSYAAIGDSWEKGEKKQFIFQAKDTINRYHVFITVRNNENYKFNNLFLIASMKFPDGKIIADTLEYAMAKPDGEWLGSGFTSVKESKLWYKENMVFPIPGAYYFSLEHAMRKNGVVAGIRQLEGITDIGIKIDKSDK